MTDIVQKDKLKELLEKNLDFMRAAVPAHVKPERLMNMALTAYTNVPGLRECWLPSVIGGVIQASIVGLELNTPLGQAYLIPFKDTKSGRKIAQLIIGYKGYIRLMQNSGFLKAIHADVVRQNDRFEYQYGLEQKLLHIPAPGNRGEITHFYCYVLTQEGGAQFEVMTKAQADSVMARSPTQGKFGPWKDDYEQMGIKTPIRRIAKYVPLSAEVQRIAQIDEMGDAGLQDLSVFEGNVIEGEIDDDGDSKTPPDESAKDDKPPPKRGRRGRPKGSKNKKDEDESVPDEGQKPKPDKAAGARTDGAELSFDTWLERLDKAESADDFDLLEDQIRDLKAGVQNMAKAQLAQAKETAADLD